MILSIYREAMGFVLLGIYLSTLLPLKYEKKQMPLAVVENRGFLQAGVLVIFGLY